MTDDTINFKFAGTEITWLDLCETAEQHPEIIRDEIDREFVAELNKDPAFIELKKRMDANKLEE